MQTRWSKLPVELIAALAAWLAVGSPVLLDAALRAEPGAGLRLLIWVSLWLAFGLVFGAVASRRLDHLSYRTHRHLLALVTALAVLAMVTLPAYDTTAILLILTAVLAAHMLPPGAAYGWIGAQGLAVLLVAWTSAGDPGAAWMIALRYLAFMLFAYLTTRSSIRETEAKQIIARTNAELRAAQQLLLESQRADERLRIARELHDLLGHHITALILNLDVASRMSEGKAREKSLQAHGIAKSLLGDVREAVQAIRRDDSIDISGALETIAANVPHPTIHLTLPDELTVEDANRGHALLRCVQEIVTNAVRHSDANHLWIECVNSDSGVIMKARDDGKGADLRRTRLSPGELQPDSSPELRASSPNGDSVGPGVGLSSIRARLEAVGGSLQIESSAGAGFAVTAFVPGGGE